MERRSVWLERAVEEKRARDKIQEVREADIQGLVGCREDSDF